MTERVIALHDLRPHGRAPAVPEQPLAPSGLLSDTLGRPLRDLRISVTDRCNFRCSYCMPKEVFDRDYAFLPHRELLSFEEITRTARLFVAPGVHKLRLTGGVPLARHVRGSGIILRFIEFMDVGTSNGWRMDDVLPSAQVLERLSAVYPLEPVEPNAIGETAERWRYVDGAGEVGLISSVTQAFCRDCNRARLSTEGQLYLCLFASHGHDLRALLRGSYSDEQIAGAIGLIWQQRGDRYSELRGSQGSPTGERRVEMSYIGG